jgi:hypothetical protein
MDKKTRELHRRFDFLSQEKKIKIVEYNQIVETMKKTKRSAYLHVLLDDAQTITL